MTRGNQRELAREKNLKKDAKSKKGSGDNGYDKAKKTLTNAEIMRQKQAKADADKAAKAAAELKEKIAAKAAKSNQGGS